MLEEFTVFYYLTFSKQLYFILTERTRTIAAGPNEAKLCDIYQKFKYAFNMLVRTLLNFSDNLNTRIHLDRMNFPYYWSMKNLFDHFLIKLGFWWTDCLTKWTIRCLYSLFDAWNWNQEMNLEMRVLASENSIAFSGS